MKRPNRDDKRELHTGEMVAMYDDKHYLQVLEKYASTLEKQLSIPVVDSQRELLICNTEGRRCSDASIKTRTGVCRTCGGQAY